jgi:hypothetical protein
VLGLNQLFVSGTNTLPLLLGSLIVGIPLLRAAFLILFRWSPLAIRHLVGTIFFFATVVGIPLLVVGELATLSTLRGDYWNFMGFDWIIIPATVGLIPFSYVLYRITAWELAKRIFPRLPNRGLMSEASPVSPPPLPS